MREAAVDADHLLASARGNRGLVGRLASTFLRECPLQLGSLARALHANDLREAEFAAHRLAGNLAMLRAGRARALAAALEKAAREGAAERARTLFSELGPELARVEEALSALGAA
ncbi:MAG: Hpt domain-containing protein [Deferrisomatales bacterium]